jgi:hypothetical protein
MNRSGLTLLGIAVLAWVGTGCGEAGASAGLRAVVDTADGVPRFTYPAEGGLMLAWRADTLHRIGDVMGEDAYQFDRVPPSGLAGDSQGNIYVLDNSGTRILSYDTEGRHRSTFGRAGEGPGELGNPIGLRVGPGDTTWVLDPINTRVTGFPPGGGDPRVVTFTNLGGFPTGSFAPLPGSFVMQSTAPIRLRGGPGGAGNFTIRGGGGGARAAAPRAGGGRATGPFTFEEGDSANNVIPVFRMSADGIPGDTLYRSTPPPVNPIQIGGRAGGGGGAVRMMVIASPPRYQPTLRWAAFADGGIIAVDTDRYELNLIAPDGSKRLIVARDMAPWPVTEVEMEYAREQVRSNPPTLFGGNIDVQQIIQQQIDNMTFAETVPRIAALAIDASDRVWVGVSLTTPGGTDRVDLYSKTGEFLGSLSGMGIPNTFFRDGRAASLVRDPDTDVQQVALIRIVEGGE